MAVLNDRAFQAHVNSRIIDHRRRGKPSDYHTVAGELLDHGIVPQRKALWDWARKACGGAA